MVHTATIGMMENLVVGVGQKHRKKRMIVTTYDNEPMIYLAAPYAHDNIQVMETRHQLVTALAGKMIADGCLVYSPLTYTVPMWTQEKVIPPNGWLEFDLPFLRKCDILMVFTMIGWQESIGVAREIKEAKKMGIPIYEVVTVEEEPGYITQGLDTRQCIHHFGKAKDEDDDNILLCKLCGLSIWLPARV